VKVTNLKRNSSLTAVERCKNPNLQKRLGFSFCTFQVLKWRSGLTGVVSTHTYAAPCYRNKHPLPPQISTSKFQPWQIKTVTPPLIRPGKRIWTSCNDALRTQMKVNGWCTPLPYPWPVTSEHGASAASVPHQSCTTHPGKNSWGDHIYGDTVFKVRLVSEPPWIENESPLVLSRTQWCDDLGNFTTNFYFNIILIR
jgi:hypothetical protein